VALSLPDRWTPLIYHAEQARLVTAPERFKVVAAGRRSGKTERAKRKLVECCLDPPRVDRPTFVAAAPTRDQAKRIFWEDLKALSPREWVAHVSESELTIHYETGARLMVIGIDRPQRIEGIAIDGAEIDEYAECRSEAWTQSMRPALSTRGRPPGWCWFTGRPKGRNHFYDLFQDAKTRQDWAAFHWPSADLLSPEEIEAARRDLDPLTFSQEYEAAFVSFEGLAYYQWDRALHCRPVQYVPGLPLVFCFDFNVDPGVAVVVQEQNLPADRCACGELVATGKLCPKCRVVVPPLQTTCVIGEVHIPKNSNTPAVCNRLASDWHHHKGEVHLYGDATGGARRTTQVEGNDWEMIRSYLKPHFQDLRSRVGRSNPPERDRVNSVNTRLRSAAGVVRIAVNAQRAPNVVKDFEGVALLEGGSGEIDKKHNEALTHLTDALGYYVHERHPLGGHIMGVH
jgi:hypothetical protein